MYLRIIECPDKSRKSFFEVSDFRKMKVEINKKKKYMGIKWKPTKVNPAIYEDF